MDAVEGAEQPRHDLVAVELVGRHGVSDHTAACHACAQHQVGLACLDWGHESGQFMRDKAPVAIHEDQ